MAHNPKLISFNGSEEVKEKYILRIKSHMLADEIIQGTGFDKQSNKGCAIGCTLDGYNHVAYETELGIPMILAVAEDNLFERLSVEDSKTFPLEFLEAIPVGVNLDNVYPLLFAWQMTDPVYGIINFIKEEDKAPIQKLSELYTQLGTGQISFDEFKNADRAYLAYLADLAYRAYLAYLAYRAYLADRADRAYRAYLAYRADLAYRAYLAYRADLAYYFPAMRAKLIQLLKEAK